MAHVQVQTNESLPGAETYTAPVFRVSALRTGTAFTTLNAGNNFRLTFTTGTVSWNQSTRTLTDTDTLGTTISGGTSAAPSRLNRLILDVQRLDYPPGSTFNGYIEMTDCINVWRQGLTSFGADGTLSGTNGLMTWILTRNEWWNPNATGFAGWGNNHVNRLDNIAGSQTDDTYYGVPGGGWFVQHNRMPAAWSSTGTTFIESVFNTDRFGTGATGVSFDGALRSDAQGSNYITRIDPVTKQV